MGKMHLQLAVGDVDPLLFQTAMNGLQQREFHGPVVGGVYPHTKGEKQRAFSLLGEAAKGLRLQKDALPFRDLLQDDLADPLGRAFVGDRKGQIQASCGVGGIIDDLLAHHGSVGNGDGAVVRRFQNRIEKADGCFICHKGSQVTYIDLKGNILK